MTTFIFIFLLALAVTLAGTPWVRRFAIWSGFVDAPEKRKIHGQPMPLLGGVAIFGGATVAVLILGAFGVRPFDADNVRGVFLAGALLALVGLIDDRRGLPARLKLLAQIGSFLVLLYFGIHVRLPIPLLLNYFLTLVWVVGISNAINFLDNMDGLSAGVSAVASAFILVLGAINDQFLVAGLAAAVLGACAGFLRYNFKPARIFMGDAGALFLGYLLAVMGLQLRFANREVVTWMVPIFILIVPIFDMCLVVFSRLRRGVSPNTAGKDHISHRLVGLGFSQREAVLLLYLVGCMGGITAIFITQANRVEGYGLGMLAALIGLYAIFWFERTHNRFLEQEQS